MTILNYCENNTNWKGGKIEKNCEECGIKMLVWNYQRNTKKYCSHNCSLKHTSVNGGWNKGKPITGKWLENLSISHLGQKAWNKGELIEKECLHCGSKFHVNPCNSGMRFCSHKCFTDWRKETGAIRGSNHPQWGTKNISCTGENNINWKGGVSKENHSRWSIPENLHWRKEVFERDNYTCQECGKTGEYLEAHHIKSWADYPELRYDINNGTTYCTNCHAINDKFRAQFVLGGKQND